MAIAASEPPRKARRACPEQATRLLRLVVALALLCAASCLSTGCAQSVGRSNNSDTATFKTGDEPTYSPEAAERMSAEAAGAAPVGLSESGWWAKDGYVHYGIVVENPNEGLVARDVAVRISLYDGDGAMIGQEETTIALVGPGASVGHAGTAGEGLVPARVDFELVEGAGSWQSAEGFEDPFVVTDIEEQDKLYFRYEVTGLIENRTDAYVSTVPLSIILRDEGGAIVAGYVGEAYRVKSGQVKSLLVTMHSAPDHATVEVYPQPY